MSTRLKGQKFGLQRKRLFYRDNHFALQNYRPKRGVSRIMESAEGERDTHSTSDIGLNIPGHSEKMRRHMLFIPH